MSLEAVASRQRSLSDSAKSFQSREAPQSRTAKELPTTDSRAEFSQEFLLVHPVLESLPAVDEDNRNFVVVKAPEFRVGVHVHLAPCETAPLVKFGQALLDDLAEMAPLAGIHDNLVALRHGTGV